MTAPVWLEVARNGAWSRARQPNIPVHADEIVEAALAYVGEGEAIVHFHSYDPASATPAFEHLAQLAKHRHWGCLCHADIVRQGLLRQNLRHGLQKPD